MLNAVAVTELAPPSGLDELRERYRAFMDEHVFPNEAALAREEDAAAELIASLRARAKAEGLWAPHLPPEAGGNGQGFLAYAYLNEEIGRSAWAQLVFNCQAPDVSGSDPTGLRTRAGRDGDDWVIDGHKWFSSGAEGAAFAIVMAVTDPDAEPHRRASQIIVPADTPGVEIVRPVPVLGHAGHGWSTHCEVTYTGVRVPVANTLGGI